MPNIPTIITYCCKDIETLTKEELVEALRYLWEEQEQLRERTGMMTYFERIERARIRTFTGREHRPAGT